MREDVRTAPSAAGGLHAERSREGETMRTAGKKVNVLIRECSGCGWSCLARKLRHKFPRRCPRCQKNTVTSRVATREVGEEE